jgi:hypothetical protein
MEEFIFDDEVDEVGAEVEAHCPKCKADTQHVVVSKYEDEIRRVQCNPCGDVHPYRKPRGESDEEEPAPMKKKAQKAKPTWEQVMAKSSKKQPKPYQLGDYFKENELLSHPKFGVGFVSENIGDDKIEVTFKDDKRVLVHNRKGLTLPFMRPVAQPKGKGKKAPAPAAPAVPAPSANGSAKKGAAKAKAAPAKPAPKPKKPATKAKAAARTATKKPTAKAAVKKIKKKHR